MTRIRHVVALAVTSTCFAPAALGDLITYTVDPVQSFLTLSGTANGIPIQTEPLISGSLATPYAGTVSVDRNFVGNTAQIINASIAAQNIGATVRADDSPANYGFIALTTDGSELAYWGAVADFAFSISGPALNATSSFDTSSLTLSTISGELDYGTYSQELLRGMSSAATSLPSNIPSQPGSSFFTDVADSETLSIPIDMNFMLELNGPVGSVYPFDGHLTGTIVATAPVPEPGSLALLLAFGGLSSLVSKRARKAAAGGRTFFSSLAM